MYRGNLNPNLHKVYKNSSGLAAPDNSIHIPKRYYEVLDVFSPADPKQHFLQIWYYLQILKSLHSFYFLPACYDKFGLYL